MKAKNEQAGVRLVFCETVKGLAYSANYSKRAVGVARMN